MISCLLHFNRKMTLKKRNTQIKFVLIICLIWSCIDFKRNLVLWLEMCLKRIWFWIFVGWRNFAGERCLSGEHFTSSGAKIAWTIDLKLRTLIFNRILNKNTPGFFLTVSLSLFFYFNNLTSFESVICMKESALLKADYSKNIWK